MGDRFDGGSGHEFDELLAAARRGDRSAIASIWRVEQPRLLRVLRTEAGDAADDIASQTWLELMGALRRFEGDERGFRALLYTIARRRLADHRRTQRRKPAQATDPEVLAALRSVGPRPDARGDAEAEVVAAIGADDLLAAISAILPPEQVEVLVLRVVAGLSVDQVAAIVGRKPGAVRVQQHRALKRLADALGEADQP
jgi:RNA polymerase sigma-70 factor (ECF subfamily)